MPRVEVRLLQVNEDHVGALAHLQGADAGGEADRLGATAGGEGERGLGRERGRIAGALVARSPAGAKGDALPPSSRFAGLRKDKPKLKKAIMENEKM